MAAMQTEIVLVAYNGSFFIQLFIFIFQQTSATIIVPMWQTRTFSVGIIAVERIYWLMNSCDSAPVVSANNTKRVGFISSPKLDRMKYVIVKREIMIKYERILSVHLILTLFTFVIIVANIYAKRNKRAILPNKFKYEGILAMPSTAFKRFVIRLLMEVIPIKFNEKNINTNSSNNGLTRLFRRFVSLFA